MDCKMMMFVCYAARNLRPLTTFCLAAWLPGNFGSPYYPLSVLPHCNHLGRTP